MRRVQRRALLLLAGLLVVVAGSIAGGVYLAGFFAALCLAEALSWLGPVAGGLAGALGRAALFLGFPILLFAVSLLPGLGALLYSRGRRGLGEAVLGFYATLFTLWPAVLAATSEPSGTAGAVATVVAGWLAALLLGSGIADAEPVTRLLAGFAALNAASPLGAVVADVTGSFSGDLDVVLVSLIEAAGAAAGLAAWLRGAAGPAH